MKRTTLLSDLQFSSVVYNFKKVIFSSASTSSPYPIVSLDSTVLTYFPPTGYGSLLLMVLDFHDRFYLLHPTGHLLAGNVILHPPSDRPAVLGLSDTRY